MSIQCIFFLHFTNVLFYFFSHCHFNLFFIYMLEIVSKFAFALCDISTPFFCFVFSLLYNLHNPTFFTEPSNGDLHGCLPALPSEHSGCYPVSAPYMDRWHCRHLGVPGYCRLMLFLRKYLILMTDTSGLSLDIEIICSLIKKFNFVCLYSTNSHLNSSQWGKVVIVCHPAVYNKSNKKLKKL